MNVPISRTSWSPSSRRTTGHYDERATDYESLRCQCRKCSVSFIFTAEAQQVAYEVKQKYVWSLPAYCEACCIELLDFQTRNRNFQTQWNAASEVLRENRAFVTEWISVLNKMSEFGKGNPCMETHLARLCDQERLAYKTNN